MNTVFIIPTGMGCAIGGHAGDATPAAKLIAQVSDKIILHPNVVNASDINEMPCNALYVEGSMLDRFLEGEIDLQEVSSNRVLVAVNPPLLPETENAINAAKATIGLDAEIMVLDTPLQMRGWIEHGVATGEATGVKDLIAQVSNHHFDALAVASPIDVPEGVAWRYFTDAQARINPWGAIEAQVSRQISDAINLPVAHAPIECSATKGDPGLFNILYERVVSPAKAAEVCSSCYIHCILKGLHRAPRIGAGIPRSSVTCMVSPDGCIGRPHRACFDADIPIVAVKENSVTATARCRDDRIKYVENYWEAAGYISCLNAGIFPDSARLIGTSCAKEPPQDIKDENQDNIII